MLDFSNKKLILNKLKKLEELKKKITYWNISFEQGNFLSNLVLEKKPENILEIGTSNGFSTLFLALNLDAKCNLTTIEINKNRFEEAKRNFEECNLKMHLFSSTLTKVSLWCELPISLTLSIP